jgi:hypothetical protein
VLIAGIGPLTARGRIYVALIVFVTISVFIAGAVWPEGAPPEWWTFLVQLYGVMAFTYGWECADARQLGQDQSPAAAVLTIVFVFVGHAAYLYQSRPLARAAAVWLLYWAGVVLVWIAAASGASAVFGDGR